MSLNFASTVQVKSVIFNYLSISITEHIEQLVSDTDTETKQSTHDFVTNILNTLPQLMAALEISDQQNNESVNKNNKLYKTNTKNISKSQPINNTNTDIINNTIMGQTQSTKSNKLVKKSVTITSDNDLESSTSDNDDNNEEIVIKMPRNIICPIPKLLAKSKKQTEYNMSAESISEFLKLFIIETFNYNDYIVINTVREKYVIWCNENKDKYPSIAKNSRFEEILTRKNSLGLPQTLNNKSIWRGYKWL